ncbi:MAG: tRNA pseudouridine(55) synthase TruB, partial [Pseudobutyrivibrio sp.]|nr:tRNA pseudouridine(55) synthase TruB [Pseudobutyrivibrio sp.]
VYKEAGYTSFDVVARLRGILKIKKIGHTGTLDPDATGVLPVCIGKATRVCDMLTDKDKIYEATLRLGVVTDTYDISGKIINNSSVNCNEKELIDVIKSFEGDILQVPPMYSALKVDGKKLYEYARAGVEIERKSRPVTIYSIEVIDVNLPEAKIRVHCSKGTYIRSLIFDIGEKLGCGATMTALIRTKAGSFDLSDAKPLDEIERIVRLGNIDRIITKIDELFDSYPVFFVAGDEEVIKHAINGCVITADSVFSESVSDFNNLDRVRMYLLDNRFIGIYQYIPDVGFKLEKMFLE